MHDPYYSNRLYPLQDSVSKIIDGCETEFYLTGGTALSRHYFNHRYSDDLDFFLNDHPDFQRQVDDIIKTLKEKWNNGVSLSLMEDTFVRLFINENEVSLKVEFINDVQFHAGDFVQSNLFSKVDSLQNILSNKISAISRDEPKDVADLLIIARNFSFNWEQIIAEAKQKDNWVNELAVSKSIHEFSVMRFERLKWIQEPDLNEALLQLKKMAHDVLTASDNSLH